MKHLRWVLLSVVAILSACGSASGPAAPPTAAPSQPWVVRLVGDSGWTVSVYTIQHTTTRACYVAVASGSTKGGIVVLPVLPAECEP